MHLSLLWYLWETSCKHISFVIQRQVVLVTRQNPTTHTDLPQKWFSSLFTCGAAGQFLLLLKLARVVGVPETEMFRSHRLVHKLPLCPRITWFIQRQTAKCTWLWNKFPSWRITDTSPFPCSLPRPHEVRRKTEAGQGASRGEGQIFRWVGASRWKDWGIAREWRPLVLVAKEVAVVSMHQIAKDKVKQLCCAKISNVNAFAYCLVLFLFFAASL